MFKLGEHAAAPCGEAIIFASELDYISRCILDYPSIETGGQLFGYWTAKGVPVVLMAIGPGPRANHEYAFFNQDLDYLEDVGHRLVADYGLQHMGEWHSHHELGLDRPSGHDASTVANGVRRAGLGRCLLCIGTCRAGASTLNGYLFTEEDGYDYQPVAWRVIPRESPFRLVAGQDRGLQARLVDPATSEPRHGRLLRVEDGARWRAPDFGADSWLNDRSNAPVLKRLVDSLADVSDGGSCRVALDGEKRIHLLYAERGRDIEILLPPRFPSEAPKALVDGAEQETAWAYAGDVEAAFAAFHAQLAAEPPPQDAAPEPPPEDAAPEPSQEDATPEPSAGDAVSETVEEENLSSGSGKPGDLPLGGSEQVELNKEEQVTE